MTSEYLFAELKAICGRAPEAQMRPQGWTWRTGGAIFGLFCGIISPVIGSVLTAIAWFTGSEWNGLSMHRVGTVLLFLTIPFLIFGAHCLDLVDKQNKEASTPHFN